LACNWSRTRPDRLGQKVRRLLIEEGADIRKEYYVAALTDRTTQKVAMMASSEGGMDIEEVAHKTPEKILKVFIDPVDRADRRAGGTLANGIGVPADRLTARSRRSRACTRATWKPMLRWPRSTR
jgi:succinyl-CoA synthetase beta subunit